MKFAVKVLPKPEVLDTQGRAVQESLSRQGFDLNACQVGRYIILDVSGDGEKAKAQAEAIVKKGLYNPLIETFELDEL